MFIYQCLYINIERSLYVEKGNIIYLLQPKSHHSTKMLVFHISNRKITQRLASQEIINNLVLQLLPYPATVGLCVRFQLWRVWSFLSMPCAPRVLHPSFEAVHFCSLYSDAVLASSVRTLV